MLQILQIIYERWFYRLCVVSSFNLSILDVAIFCYDNFVKSVKNIGDLESQNDEMMERSFQSADKKKKQSKQKPTVQIMMETIKEKVSQLFAYKLIKLELKKTQVFAKKMKELQNDKLLNKCTSTYGIKQMAHNNRFLFSKRYCHNIKMIKVKNKIVNLRKKDRKISKKENCYIGENIDLQIIDNNTKTQLNQSKNDEMYKIKSKIYFKNDSETRKIKILAQEKIKISKQIPYSKKWDFKKINRTHQNGQLVILMMFLVFQLFSQAAALETHLPQPLIDDNINQDQTIQIHEFAPSQAEQLRDERISQRRRNLQASGGTPILLISGVHCLQIQTSTKRISMNDNHSIDSCNNLCNKNVECVEFAFSNELDNLNRCDLYRATDCSYDTTHNFDIYRPQGNCGILQSRQMIKNLWVCGDNSALSIGSSTGGTLDQCEILCQQTSGCVWFQYNSINLLCELRPEGCEATERSSAGGYSYRPTGYVQKECTSKTSLIGAMYKCNDVLKQLTLLETTPHLKSCADTCSITNLCTEVQFRQSDGWCRLLQSGCSFDTNNNEGFIVYAVEVVDCNYSTTTPAQTSLSYDFSSTSPLLVVDFTNKWTSIYWKCTFSNCVLILSGCTNLYNGQNLSVVSGKQIYGQSNVMAGWNENVCVECTDSYGLNKQQNNLAFSQTALDCDPSLVPISQASPISIPFVSGGAGVIYQYTDFFTYTQIAGCTLNCNYGDTCGGSFSGSAADVQVTLSTTPWKIKASNSNISGYTKTICLQCTSNNAAASFQNTFTIDQAVLDCQPRFVAISQASPITITYVSGGVGVNYNINSFFTETSIPGCVYLACNYADTCGGSLSGSDVSVTIAFDPFQITAWNSNVVGYSKTLCIQCQSNNNAQYENTFTIQQTMLDCSNLLVVNGGAPTSISLPYLDGGSNISNNYLDIFDLSPISDCSVIACKYGNTCGLASTISGTQISETQASPYPVSYSQSFKDGYSYSICLYCIATNNYEDTHTIQITQIALKCDPSLVSISHASPITIQYLSGGAGINYNFNDFFTLTSIAGCIIDCNYGDTCGTSTSLSGTDISIQNTANPWEINAANIIKQGYEKSLCLQCSMNNALTNSPISNTFMIKQLLLDCQYQYTAPQIYVLEYLYGSTNYIEMADYTNSFITSVPFAADCSIDSLVFKSEGCIDSYISNNLQINGLKIEGKQNIALSYSETVCLEFTDSSGVTYNYDSLTFEQNLPVCDYIQADPTPLITTLSYSATDDTFLEMGDYSSAQTTLIPVCSIVSIMLKNNGCSIIYSGNLQVNGQTIEGKQNLVNGYSQFVCIIFTDSSGVTYNMDGLLFTQTKYYPPVMTPNKCTHQEVQQQTETIALCLSIQTEHICSLNTDGQGAKRCQWINPNGISADCNNIQSLVSSIVQDVQLDTDNIIKEVNDTIKFQIILKTQSPEPYIIAIKNFLYFNGTGTEEFCGAKELSQCESSSCLAGSLSEQVSLDNNPTVLDSQGKMNPILTISRAQPLNQFIYLQASNPYAISVPVESIVKGIVVVCGQEKVVLNDGSNQVFNIKGINNRLNPFLTYDLEGIWNVDTTDLFQSPEECPIEKWKMCDDALCEAETVEKWQYFDSGYLKIDIGVGIPQVSKFLVAMTSGKAMGSHPIIILICGQEKVDLLSQLSKQYQKTIGSDTITQDLAVLFKNSDEKNCPITSYSLQGSSGYPLTVEEASFLSLKDNILEIMFTEVKTFIFYAIAETASGSFGKQKFVLIVEADNSNDKPFFIIDINSEPEMEEIIEEQSLDSNDTLNETEKDTNSTSSETKCSSTNKTECQKIDYETQTNENQVIDDNFENNSTNGTVDDPEKYSNSSIIEKQPEEVTIEPQKILFPEPEVKITRKNVPVISNFKGVKIKQEKKVYKPPEPIKIIVYENVEEIFERENPALRKTTIDKKGNLQINFSKGMVYPPNWYNMQINDQNRKKGNSSRLLQEKAEGKNFPRLMVVNAFGEEMFEVERIDYKLNQLDPTRIELKIEWFNPSIISLSSQNQFDNLIIKWPNDLILTDADGNSVVMDEAIENEVDGTLETTLILQPQLDEKSPQQEQFENSGDSVKTTGKFITAIQFGITYFFQTSLAHFWGLINSQQNLCYLPSINVNLPAPVSSYTEKLITVATFDPIPMDIVYDSFGIFDFQWTQQSPSVTTFEPIGYEDCVFVLALGSMFLWMSIFLLCVIVPNFTDCFKFNNLIRKFGKKFKIGGYYRVYIIVFLLEGYIDLFISALINLDNEHLLHVPGNFGLYGNLNKSDQFSIILGLVFYYACLIFPIFVQYISWKKINQNLFRMHRQANFEKMYSCLYEGFKTHNQGPMLFSNVFILRRMLFVWVCFFYSDPVFTCFQVFFNLLLSCAYLAYLLVMKPYEDQLTQKLEVINELSYTLISYHLICFTDFNEDAESKLLMGYSMIGCSILNMCFPNLYLVLGDIVPVLYDEVKKWFYDMKKPKVNMEARNFFEEKRQELIKNYDIKLKEEFKIEGEEEDDSEDYETLTEIKKNKIVPLEVLEKEAMKQMQKKNIYEYREQKRQEKMTMKKLSKRPIIDLENSLSKIQEDTDESQQTSFIQTLNSIEVEDDLNKSQIEKESSNENKKIQLQNFDFDKPEEKEYSLYDVCSKVYSDENQFGSYQQHSIQKNEELDSEREQYFYKSSSDNSSIQKEEVKQVDDFNSYSAPPTSSKHLISLKSEASTQRGIRNLIYGIQEDY